MNVLFLIAHPDDEAYGPYGTILKLVNEGHKVTVFCLCNGERPGNVKVSADRVFAYKANCEAAGVEWKIQNNADLSLTYNETVSNVIGIVEFFNPDVIYTHNISDLNNDHRIVAEAALVACRPKPNSTVKQLYFFEIPSSTDWTFNQVRPAFNPTVYVEISDNHLNLKKAALANYQTETYEFPDARSVDAMVTLAKYRGYQVGYNYAEAFKLVFQKS
jgi:LmbE family N-acetylglucosaminyl deacetylase